MLKINKSLYNVNSKSFFKNKLNKKFNIGKKINHATILYLQNTESNLKCLDNLLSYKYSKNSDLIIISDEDFPALGAFNFIKIKRIPNLENSNDYSSYIFLNALEIAIEFCLDYFFYYEWDCKVGKDFWYDDLWEEHLNWPEPIMTGTPIIKIPMKNPIGNFLCGIERYRYEYLKQCSVAMSVYNARGISQFSVHTNGALAFYNTNKLKKIFHKSIKKVNRKSIKVISPWDSFLGISVYKELGNKCFDKIGWLPSSYSGCGDEFYSQTQRNFMLESGLKSVIHQNKY